LLLALVAGLLSLVPTRMKRESDGSILSELYAHVVYLGASLSTTIVSTFLGNYSSALLTQVRTPPVPVLSLRTDTRVARLYAHPRGGPTGSSHPNLCRQERFDSVAIKKAPDPNTSAPAIPAATGTSRSNSEHLYTCIPNVSRQRARFSRGLYLHRVLV